MNLWARKQTTVRIETITTDCFKNFISSRTSLNSCLTFFFAAMASYLIFLISSALTQSFKICISSLISAISLLNLELVLANSYLTAASRLSTLLSNPSANRFWLMFIFYAWIYTSDMSLSFLSCSSLSMNCSSLVVGSTFTT